MHPLAKLSASTAPSATERSHRASNVGRYHHRRGRPRRGIPADTGGGAGREAAQEMSVGLGGVWHRVHGHVRGERLAGAERDHHERRAGEEDPGWQVDGGRSYGGGGRGGAETGPTARTPRAWSG